MKLNLHKHPKRRLWEILPKFWEQAILGQPLNGYFLRNSVKNLDKKINTAYYMHYIYDQRKFKNFFLSSAQNYFPVALFLNILATHGVETIHFLRLALVCSSFLRLRYLWVHFLTLLRTWNYYSFIGSSSEFDLSYLEKLLFVVWVWFSMRIFDGTFLKIPVITGECDLYSASMEGLLAIKNQLCDPKH